MKSILRRSLVVFKIFFLPFALLYGLIIWLRNKMYDSHLLTAIEFDIPTIAVGNLAVGGTGKTPHVEYLIRLLKDHYQIAVLSRGYNRRSRGYKIAGEGTTSLEIGDEPMQFHLKFPDIQVAVGEERILALPQILMDAPQTQIVLLDDAFQHRSILPGFNILLTEFHRPFTRDYIVPIGKLRESRKEYKRADCILVSKCPDNLTEAQKQELIQEISPLPHQKLYFTGFQYGVPYHLFSHQPFSISEIKPTVLLVCGIANPLPVKQYLDAFYPKVLLLKFPDHYFFTSRDIRQISMEFEKIQDPQKVIITTEKDAVRLILFSTDSSFQTLPVFVLPIEVKFLFEGEESFNNHIFDHLIKYLSQSEITN
ncbi:MAG: tetraacyldisaccharide 4'-kinase [Chitinophagaceae bacterium]